MEKNRPCEGILTEPSGRHFRVLYAKNCQDIQSRVKPKPKQRVAVEEGAAAPARPATSLLPCRYSIHDRANSSTYTVSGKQRHKDAMHDDDVYSAQEDGCRRSCRPDGKHTPVRETAPVIVEQESRSGEKQNSARSRAEARMLRMALEASLADRGASQGCQALGGGGDATGGASGLGSSGMSQQQAQAAPSAAGSGPPHPQTPVAGERSASHDAVPQTSCPTFSAGAMPSSVPTSSAHGGVRTKEAGDGKPSSRGGGGRRADAQEYSLSLLQRRKPLGCGSTSRCSHVRHGQASLPAGRHRIGPCHVAGAGEAATTATAAETPDMAASVTAASAPAAGTRAAFAPRLAPVQGAHATGAGKREHAHDGAEFEGGDPLAQAVGEPCATLDCASSGLPLPAASARALLSDNHVSLGLASHANAICLARESLGIFADLSRRAINQNGQARGLRRPSVLFNFSGNPASEITSRFHLVYSIFAPLLHRH